MKGGATAAVVVNKRASCGHDRRGCCVSPAPPLLVLCAPFSFLAVRMCFFFACFFFFLSLSLSLSRANRAGILGCREALFRLVFVFVTTPTMHRRFLRSRGASRITASLRTRSGAYARCHTWLCFAGVAWGTAWIWPDRNPGGIRAH